MDYHEALRMLGQYYYHEHGANSYARTSEEFRIVAKVVEAFDILKNEINRDYETQNTLSFLPHEQIFLLEELGIKL